MPQFSAKEITYENFSKICRCCIINMGEIDMYEAHIEDSPLSSIIFTCTNEKINKTDGLPREICSICVQLIINFDAFIKTFKESQVNINYMFEVFRKKRNEQINTSEQNVIHQSEDIFHERRTKHPFEGGELKESTMEQFVAENKNISNEQQILVLNEIDENKSLQSLGDIITEEEKFLHKEQIPQNTELIQFNSDHNTSDREEYKERKCMKTQRIEVDPKLRSGLDLQCFQCLVVFSSKAEMARHHKSSGHILAPNYKCGICSKAISKRKAYWDHMAMHRHLKKKAVCEVCGVVVISLHLKRHMLVHQEKSHICHYCGKSYVQKNTLSDHIKSKHEGETKDMNTLCFICGKLCNDLKGLTSHLNTHTDEKWKKLSYHCEECGKYFLNAQSLNTHKYMAHKITERIPKQRKKTNEYKHSTLENIKLAHNLKEPKQKKEKDLIKKANIKQEPRECPICHKVICYLGFSRHLTTHTGIKPHQCKHCPKNFRLFSSLKSHMYVHLNLKPFKCEVCGLQFRHYTTLKVHKRLHTDEKPYVCSTCNKGFRSASGLKRHRNQRQHNMPS